MVAIARCGGCGSSICACFIQDTDCVIVNGLGSADSPFEFELVFDPDSDDCLNCGVDGIQLVVSPTAGNQLTCSANGLLVPAAAAAGITTTDSSTIDFSGDGTPGTPLTGSVIAGSVGIVTTDSGSIDFSGDGTTASPLTATAIAGGAFDETLIWTLAGGI